MEKFIFVYITSQDREEAKKIARHLLKKRLIACANVFAVESLYWRKDKIVDGKEFAMIGKTIGPNFKKLKKEVSKIHSYSVPCIAKIPVELNERYAEWLKSEIVYSNSL